MNCYKPDDITAYNLYPFGSEMPNRSFSSGSYRYGFNGKEKDAEVSGEGNSYDYGFRIYNPRIGKFLSVDPLTKKFPMLTPYQFASNRPIDGIDLDGLEYASFNVYMDNGITTKITVSKDYELKNKNTRGEGVLVTYHYKMANGEYAPYKESFKKNLHGIYQGGDNPQLPKLGESVSVLYDNYELDPIDETDAIAKQHDLDYDKVGSVGKWDVPNEKSESANDKYIKGATKIIEKYKNGEDDSVTKKPVSEKTKDAATFGKYGFNFAKLLKYGPKTTEKKNERIYKLDKYGPKY